MAYFENIPELLSGSAWMVKETSEGISHKIVIKSLHFRRNNNLPEGN